MKLSGAITFWSPPTAVNGEVLPLTGRVMPAGLIGVLGAAMPVSGTDWSPTFIVASSIVPAIEVVPAGSSRPMTPIKVEFSGRVHQHVRGRHRVAGSA